MDIRELNREQLAQVKQYYYTQKMEEQGELVYWSDLANIDELVSDEEIFEEMGYITFCEGDFE